MKNIGKLLPVGIALVTSAIFLSPLLKGQAISGHDAGYHYTRLQLFTTALQEGQLPVRWIEIPSLNLSHPLFEFYPTLFYYPAAVFQTLGASFINATALTLLLATLLGWASIYFFVRSLIPKGGSLAGTVSATLFLFTPYRISQLYVRAAFGEFLATSAIPLLFLGPWVVFKSRKPASIWWGVVWIAAGLFIVGTAHQPTLIMIAPVFILWIVLLFYQTQKNLRLGLAFIASLLGLCLSAFFLLPQIVEREYIHLPLQVQGYYDYHQHFVKTSQLIFSPWGYGVSLPGPNDSMSFQMGAVNWLIILGSVAIVLVLGQKSRKSYQTKKDSDIYSSFLIFFIGLTFFSLFMTTEAALPVWESLSILSFLQYPWRFLALSTFSTSILAGLVLKYWIDYHPKIPKKQAHTLLVSIVALIVIANFGYLSPKGYLPEQFLRLNDPNVISQIASVDPLFGVNPGYLPIWVKDSIPATFPQPLQVSSGSATLSGVLNKITLKKFTAEVTKRATVRINTHYFPGWVASVTQGSVKMDVTPDHQNSSGLMDLTLDPGSYTVSLRLENTPIRTLSDILTVFAAIIMIGLTLYLAKKGKKPRHAPDDY